MSGILFKLKVFLINIIILIIFILLIEVLFGYWFKNEFSEKLAAERNINRIYNFSFQNYKGSSHYIRDNNGFRIPNKNFETVDAKIVFVGGSTTNQKFLNYDDTLVGLIQKKLNNTKIINAGIDGMSLLGHVNSFENWFDKIENFKPQYYIFYVGINEQRNLDQVNKDEIRPVDNLIESSKKKSFVEYMESNSFFFTNLRKLKVLLFLKTGNKIFSNNINSKTLVYKEREEKKFITFKDFKIQKNNKNIDNNILKLLNNLTSNVLSRNAKPVYITQISGYGINEYLYTVANTLTNHCKKLNLKCINLAENSTLNYNDFFDEMHLNPNGSKKAANFIFNELNKIIY